MITSINLASNPFSDSCDNTRLQMAAKQISQSLTHPNCEIPYIIGNDYRTITDNSSYNGILIAEYDGKILYSECDLFIFYYYEIDKVDVKYIPEFKQTTGIYSSKLRYVNKNKEFKKGDILYTYDCFIDDIPTYGYNTFCGYFPFFGYNHEDSLIVSEGFLERTKHNYVETVYVPIFEYTMMKPLYSNIENSFVYFPNIGQEINNIDNVCTLIQPKLNSITQSSNIRTRMLILLNTMNISDLMNLENNTSQFNIEKVKTKIDGGILSGYKIHKLNKKLKLLDKKLEEKLEEMYNIYINNHVLKAYNDLNNIIIEDLVNKILRKYLVFYDDGKKILVDKKELVNCVYLLELEISKEVKSNIGDKFCNRYAGKGVVSAAFPDELCPVALTSNKKIEYIYNPFGVFSRMNMSQLHEGIIGKNVMYCNELIKNNNLSKSDTLDLLQNFLNEKIIKYLGNDNYYKNMTKYFELMKSDNNIYSEFINNVKQNNLYIEAPTFSEKDFRKICKNSISPNEDIFISKKFLMYMQDKLKVKFPFTIKDTYIKNIFCVPIYIQKLYKLVDKTIIARDIGPYKQITKQPMKGRVTGGASKLGQMDIEGLIAHGCLNSLQEFITVKSDYIKEKNNLNRQIISNGYYEMPEMENNSGGTNIIVSQLIKFLNE